MGNWKTCSPHLNYKTKKLQWIKNAGFCIWCSQKNLALQMLRIQISFQSMIGSAGLLAYNFSPQDRDLSNTYGTSKTRASARETSHLLYCWWHQDSPHALQALRPSCLHPLDQLACHVKAPTTAAPVLRCHAAQGWVWNERQMKLTR